MEQLNTRLNLLINFLKTIFSYHYLNSYSNQKFTWDWKSINFNRVALLNLIISNYKKCSYLELGCANNFTFNSITTLDKDGVDPIKGGTIRLTSDSFFKLNKKKYDVIFIDGLHTYEQARKDLINSIKFLKKNGVILLHDILPRNWKEQHVPCITRKEWTGDVWKIAFELVANKNIKFSIVKIDHGVGVLKLTHNKLTLKKLEFGEKPFSYYYNNIKKLPIISYEQITKQKF